MGLQQYFDGLLKKKGYLDIMTACFISLVAAGALMPRSWSGINDFVYQLQKIDLTKMGKTKFDLVIIDYAKDNGQPFTAKEIFDLKNSRGGKKMVLAYMSIGEAESYRDFYWNEDWVEGRTTGEPTQKASEWLGSENQEWSGNYKVKYWEQAWQDIIFGHSTSYLDRIMKAGFDGVYLDIIDAYEYWGPGGESGLNRVTAEQEMVDFVEDIANYARVTLKKKNFAIFPQNGEDLASHSNYVQLVTGIGKEDTWYDDNTHQDPQYTSDVIKKLNVFKKAGKLVLVTDYVTKKKLIDKFYKAARDQGYVPYATVRDLDKLTINLQHKPD